MGIFNKAVSQTLPVVPKPIVGYFARRYIAVSSVQSIWRLPGCCCTWLLTFYSLVK